MKKYDFDSMGALWADRARQEYRPSPLHHAGAGAVPDHNKKPQQAHETCKILFLEVIR